MYLKYRPFTAIKLVSKFTAIGLLTVAALISIILLYAILGNKMQSKDGLHVTLLWILAYVNVVILSLYLLSRLVDFIFLFWPPFRKESQVFFKFLEEFHGNFFRQEEALKRLGLPANEESRELHKLHDKRYADSIDIVPGMRITKDSHSWRQPGRLHIAFTGSCYPELEARFRLFLDWQLYNYRTKPWLDVVEVLVVPADDEYWLVKSEE